jgi:hypothetical protein
MFLSRAGEFVRGSLTRLILVAALVWPAAGWAASFAEWLESYGLPAAVDELAQQADPDGDGAGNLMEYAWGTNPVSAVSRPEVTGGWDQGRRRMVFPRDPARTELSYHVETSTDLANWSTVARSVYGRATVSLGGAHTVAETGAGPFVSTVEVAAGAGHGFERVRVSYKEKRPVPGLLWADGIEPGDPSVGEAPVGKRNWWVDADAATGGDGSFAAPFNHFGEVETLVGGGDFVYVRGTFDMAQNSSTRQMTLNFYRSQASGTPEAPTTLKSWKGSPRAVFVSRRTSAQLRARASGGVRYQNIELRNFGDQGIVIGEAVTHAEFVSVLVHDGEVTAGSGIGGAIVMYAADSLHRFMARHCEIHDTADANPGNNSGAFSVISEPGAHEGSRLVVRDCLFHDNHIAVRHKHAGRVHMEAFNNRFEDNTIAFYLRMWTSEVRHNLFLRNGTAVQLDSDNMNADHAYHIHHNTFYETDWIASAMPDQGGFVADLRIEDNVYVDPTPEEGVIRIGAGGWNWGSNDLSGWTMARNIFSYAPGTRYFFHSAPPTASLSQMFAAAMSQLGDTTSVQIDPLLNDPAGGDFTLKANSPAIGFGSDGSDAGAF